MFDYDYVYFESLRFCYYFVMNFFIKLSFKYNSMVWYVDNKYFKVCVKKIKMKIFCYQSVFLCDVDIFYLYIVYNFVFLLR